MALFGLIKDKCFYCRNSIQRGEEFDADVKVVGYTGTFSKKFCSKEHVNSYVDEIQKVPKKSGGGGCC